MSRNVLVLASGVIATVDGSRIAYHAPHLRATIRVPNVETRDALFRMNFEPIPAAEISAGVTDFLVGHGLVVGGAHVAHARALRTHYAASMPANRGLDQCR